VAIKYQEMHYYFIGELNEVTVKMCAEKFDSLC